MAAKRALKDVALDKPRHLVLKRGARAVRLFLWMFVFRAAYSLYLRHSRRIPMALVDYRNKAPFMAFTGSGLLIAYYHGIATYLRDYFNVEKLRLSAISGGCSTILALAMGIDLYQILLLGLHLKKYLLNEGVYLLNFGRMVDKVIEHFRDIGITDADVEQLADKHQCFVGVTQCFPPQHRCMPLPKTLREMAELTCCSMNIWPFYSTPGSFQGKYYVDGVFSATWSVPEDVLWNDVIKVTCFPGWCTWLPPSMAAVDLQPTKFMPTETLLLYPWSHQQVLIKRGYEDAKKRHNVLVARGLEPLPNAPLTPWSRWEELFASIDEDNLPPLSKERSTMQRSELEVKHDETLRTYSETNLHNILKGPRVRRLNSGGSQSAVNLIDYSQKINTLI